MDYKRQSRLDPVVIEPGDLDEIPALTALSAAILRPVS